MHTQYEYGKLKNSVPSLLRSLWGFKIVVGLLQSVGLIWK